MELNYTIPSSAAERLRRAIDARAAYDADGTAPVSELDYKYYVDKLVIEMLTGFMLNAERIGQQ